MTQDTRHKIKDYSKVVITNNASILLNRYKYLLSFIFYLLSGSLKSQFYNLPNDYFFGTFTQRQLAQIDSEQTHPAIQPYIPFFNKKYEFVADSYKVFKFISDDPIIDKVFFDHLIHVKSKTGKYEFKVDPLLNFEFGRAMYDTAKMQKTSTNTRGFIASGTIGKDLYFETLFAENQSQFPHYISSYNNQTKIVPGQGRYKVFKTTGYDYAFSSGFVSYQPIKRLNIQLGHGKQKIGNGYRSLLLSDNAFNYPYLRVTSEWLKGRLQYTNIYAVLMNLTTGGAKTPKNTEPLFQKKAVSFQYLSYNVNKRINIGLFQGMIWNAADSMNRQHLDWQYFNPVIFTNLGFYGLNNKNNIVIGATANVKITHKISVYGQFMGDDFSNKTSLGNAFGYQVGAKYFDAFKLKNLMLQVEYNDVAEGSYNKPLGTYSDQSYSQYNQNLAYTPGYGKELVLLGDFKYKRVFLDAKLNLQWLTLNKYALYNNTITKLQLGYTINTAYNFNVSLGYNYRFQDFLGFNASNNKTTFYTISIKSNLYNTYYDF
ncbi:MAG: hypothetical protein HY062_10005 [Bacteroidetes bacterium]|nr:hypothetical protein [Bacteroidota bacterium]